jgi:MFS family permease
MQIKSEFITKYKWIYIVNFLSEVYFAIPTWWFFYSQYLHLSDQQIIIITLVQAFSILAFEIPTGALADLFGRAKTNIFSYALFAVLLVITAFTKSFEILIVIAVLKGFANALMSGSWEALAYDTLKVNGDESQYKRLISDARFLFWMAYLVSAFVGGLLYSFDPRAPWFFTAITYLLTVVIIAFFVKEPKIESDIIVSTDNKSEDNSTLNFKAFWKQNLTGFKELFSVKSIAVVVIILLVIRIGYYVASELLGIKQAESLGFTAQDVGMLFTVGFGISAIVSLFYNKISKVLGYSALTLICGIVIVFSYSAILPSIPMLGMFLILMRTMTSTTFMNTISGYLNENITSKNRATALSTFNMFVQVGYFVIAGVAFYVLPIFGVFKFSNYIGYSIAGLLILLGLIMMFRNKKNV